MGLHNEMQETTKLCIWLKSTAAVEVISVSLILRSTPHCRPSFDKQEDTAEPLSNQHW